MVAGNAPHRRRTRLPRLAVEALVFLRGEIRASELWLAHSRANHKVTLAAIPKNTVLDLFD